MYGQGCNMTCGNCFDGEACDAVNGNCTTGCAAGFHGTLCKEGELTFRYSYATLLAHLHYTIALYNISSLTTLDKFDETWQKCVLYEV